MESREQVLENPVFPALKEVDHKPEDDIYVWSQGMAFHNQNLLDGLKENVDDPKVREKILSDLWSYFYTVGLEKANEVLGIEQKPDVDKILKFYPPGFKIRIFNAAGKLIKNLSENEWEGTNEDNQPVASGIYIYLAESNGVERTGKIALIW